MPELVKSGNGKQDLESQDTWLEKFEVHPMDFSRSVHQLENPFKQLSIYIDKTYGLYRQTVSNTQRVALSVEQLKDLKQLINSADFAYTGAESVVSIYLGALLDLSGGDTNIVSNIVNPVNFRQFVQFAGDLFPGSLHTIVNSWGTDTPIATLDNLHSDILSNCGASLQDVIISINGVGVALLSFQWCGVSVQYLNKDSTVTTIVTTFPYSTPTGVSLDFYLKTMYLHLWKELLAVGGIYVDNRRFIATVPDIVTFVLPTEGPVSAAVSTPAELYQLIDKIR